MLRAGAPIDGFGIGTSLTTSSDVPAFDCAYKLQEYAGLAAAQALSRQGDVAGSQAGLAPIRAGWPHGRRCHVARKRPAGRRAAHPIGHAAAAEGIAPPPTLAESRSARGQRSCAIAGAVATAGAGATVSGPGGGRADAAGEPKSTAAWHSVNGCRHDVKISRSATRMFYWWSMSRTTSVPKDASRFPRGHEVVPLINRLATRFKHVVLTQDWHPAGHLSFASAHPGRKPYETIEVSYGTQILWPDHCVQATPGAEFRKDLKIAHAQLVLRKGYHPRTSIPIQPSTRTTARRIPGWPDICGNAVLRAYFSPGSRSTSASATRPRMPGAKASRSWWSRMPAAGSMSTAR